MLSAQAELTHAELDLEEAQSRLAGRARVIYASGDSSMLDVLLGASSLQEFLVRLDFAVRIARADASAVQDVKAARAAVEALKDSLELREAEELALKERPRRALPRLKRTSPPRRPMWRPSVPKSGI